MKPPLFPARFSKWLKNAIIVLLFGGLAIPVLAVNPEPAYPPGKSEGEEQETNDEEEEPSSEETDCDGTSSQSDSSSGSDDSGGGTCSICPPADSDSDSDDYPACIREQVTLALAPNEPGLGAGLLKLYINATGANLGSRKYLEFFGVSEMAVTEATAQGSATNYSIVQAGSTVMPFSIQSASGAVGKPMGATAFSQARLSFVSGVGAATDKSGASSVRHYRSSSSAIDYPVAGGKATRFETKQGRAYTFPLSGVEVIREKTDGSLSVNTIYGTGLIRQVKTVAGLLDVVVLTPRSYEVRKYAPSAVGAKTNGVYSTTGAPHFTMRVVAPDNVQNALIVTKTEGSRQTVNTYAITVSGGAETWTQTVTSGDFTYDRVLKREPLASLGPDFHRTSRSSLLNAVPEGSGGASPGAKYSIVSDSYKYMPSSSRQAFSTGKVSERAISYESPGWDINGVGRPKSRINSLGGESKMLYDSETARMTGKVSTPSKPAGSGGSIPASRARAYNYQAHAVGEVQTPGDFRPRTTTTTVGAAVVGTSFFSARKVGGAYFETREHTKSSTGTYGSAANIKEEKKWYGSGPNLGRIEQVLAKDGTLTRYAYNAKPDNGLEVVTYGMLAASGSPVSGYSTRTTELRDARAWPTEITSATYINNAWVDYQTITEVRNAAGRLTDRIRKDLLTNQTRVLLHQEWDGPNLTRAVDEEGVAMSYTYFPNSNILKSTLREAVSAHGDLPAQQEILTTYSGEFTMNQAQVPVWKQRLTTITAGGITLTESHTFDEKSRVVSHTDTSGYTTSTSYTEGDKLITETLPSGAKRITAKDSEGRVLSITGNAVVARYFHYAPVVGGGQSLTVYTGLENGPRYQTTITDGAERVTNTIRPAFGGGTEVTEYVYSPAFPNSVITVNSSGKATKVCELNLVGVCEREGLTADNATLALGSATDRIVDTVITTEQDAGGIWRVTRTSTYAQENSAQSKLVSTSRFKLAGFTGTQVSRRETIDISNNTSTRTTTLDGSLRETRNARPGVTAEEVSISHAGRLTRLYQRGIADPEVTGYDALGRVVSSKQPRHSQAAITAYFPGSNLIASETDAAGHPTTFTYHPQGSHGAGEIKTITLADTTVQYHGYTSRGETQVTWGTQTYPTWNVYDSYGQLNHLHTWQSAPALDIAALPADPPAGSAVTTWNNDPATGLLANKRDADTKGADYQYDVARRLTKCTWARPHAGVRLATDYIPDSFGQITAINYADDTPDVAIVHDRLGRQSTVTQANQSKIAYNYDPANLDLDTETVQYDLDHDGTYEFTRVLDRSRDPLNRDNGFQLMDGTDLENQATYQYSSTDGRLFKVLGLASSEFTYGYTPNSNLLQTVTGPAHTVINQWEDNRDVLDIKQNNVGTADVSKYDYLVNAIGQREKVVTSGTEFPTLPTWLWGYDTLGQVTSADHSGGTTHDRSYLYDAIGNRRGQQIEATIVPTNEQGQIVPTTGTTTYSANAINQYTADNAFIPTHDLDGNQRNAQILPLGSSTLASCVYHWDAENRLAQVRAADDTTVTTTTLYDAKSRRIATTANGATTLYLYDGFNCIAEYTGDSLAITRLWGMDLTGSMQGAGGVGGLLCESQISNSQISNHFPTYDGNGNVSEYLNSTGQVIAHFEYDPFGNIVKESYASGFDASSFTYKFSTKPLDLTTGLYYYTYRYYDPMTGRWPSRDPIGERGGVNLYGFVKNEGTNLVDPLGQAPLSVDSSCAGHEDLLENMTYFAEEEPHDEDQPEPPKNFRALPPPGEQVSADALYEGNGTATKLPDSSSADVICICEKNVWRAEVKIKNAPWPWPQAKRWERGKPAPPAWPADPNDADNHPYNGAPTTPVMPPLDPAAPPELSPMPG